VLFFSLSYSLPSSYQPIRFQFPARSFSVSLPAQEPCDLTRHILACQFAALPPKVAFPPVLCSKSIRVFSTHSRITTCTAAYTLTSNGPIFPLGRLALRSSSKRAAVLFPVKILFQAMVRSAGFNLVSRQILDRPPFLCTFNAVSGTPAFYKSQQPPKTI